MVLDLARLKDQHLALGIDFSLVDELASTNDEAFKLLAMSSFCAVVAKRQNSGRGRLGRRWEGKEGDCIFYSAGFKMPENFNIGLVTCSIAIEILNLIDPHYTPELSIKWPNDLYYKGRKLCGILTESKAKGGKIDSVVIGIGFNINMPSDFSEFRREPSCLSEFSDISTQDMIVNLSKAVKNSYEKLCKEYLGFSEEFARRDFLKGKEVGLVGENLKGTALGVDDSAKIKILSDNKIHLLNAGELSIL